MDASERRARELLSALLDETCSDAERDELQALLRQSPQLAAGLADQTFVHSLLLWQSEDITECLDMELAANGEQLALPQPQQRSPRTAARPWLWALAASLLLGAGIAVWQGFQRSRQGDVAKAADGAIGEIIDEREVFWSNASTALRKEALQNGRRIYPGILQTNAGAYTIRFDSGPTMHVSGGSSLTIESDMLVRLDRGQATAEVPESGIGFTIKTPVVNVVDQGTEFGVAVDEQGQTDVVVFEGSVDLEEKAGDPSPTQVLVRGEGVRIDPQGVVARIMQIHRDLNSGWWTAPQPEFAEHVIEEVSDNVPPPPDYERKYFCYQITYNGLVDDAFAYADDPHQWNGLDRNGLPSFLRGADYVKTFNDYRYMEYLEMTVKLRRPANLYVFFDNRVPLPSWLESQFEDTGVDIGLDEGPWAPWDQALRPDLPVFKNAVGSGMSIDNVFSVWRRRCDAPCEVVLGPVGPTSEARAMYGFAATPLE